MAALFLRRFREIWRTGYHSRREESSGPSPAAQPPREVSEELGRLLEVVRPFTLSDPLRLSLLYGLACEVLRDVPGDIVECGVCNGGSAAILAAPLTQTPGRLLWLYDTFAGLPAPGPLDGREAPRYAGDLRGSREAVGQVIGRVGFPLSRAVFREGNFQETFQQPLPEAVALLHIDADWYEGVLSSLRTLYPRVPPGGIIVLDDFGHWEGARRAFYDFCKSEGIAPLIERVGYTQAFWRKGQEHSRNATEKYAGGIYRPGW